MQYYHKVKEHLSHSLCWSKGSTRLLVLMIRTMPAASCVQTTHSVAWDIKTTVCLFQPVFQVLPLYRATWAQDSGGWCCLGLVTRLVEASTFMQTQGVWVHLNWNNKITKRWAGILHGEIRNSHKIQISGWKTEGMTQFEKFSYRWEDNIKVYLGNSLWRYELD